MNTLRYTCQSERGPIEGTIALSNDSPWCSVLGQMPLPEEGVLEKIDATLSGRHIDAVQLIGCPAAALLPLLWFRSIWCAQGTPINIEWPVSDLDSDPPQRQSASRLACLLADQVECSQPGRVWSSWGFDPGSPGIAEEAFDLLINLVDLWDPDLRLAHLGEDWSEAMRKVLAKCALDGYNRIGIYGAGTHTRGVGDAFMQPPVEIRCIIDDDTRRVGETLWGFPIVSPEQAVEIGLDAVVLSANSIEDLLWDRASVLRDRGIPTVRIYGQDESNEELIDAHA
ncbi:MAG: hypothetical protein ACF8MF_07470 [Phycisphaerales bacterium JB052]